MSQRATLRYQLQRPMCIARDVSSMPVKGCADVIREHVKKRYEQNLASPETEALRFYLLNHGLAEIRKRYDLDDELPPSVLELVELYHSELNDLAVRTFAYLVLICTREARHGNKPHSLYTELTKRFGKNASDFHRQVAGTGSSSSANAFMNNPPEDTTLGQFVSQLAYVFYDSPNQPGGGYGGKKWGAIADVLVAYVYGKGTAGAMLDTAWTLAHNGGPIFNKGMCFSHYNSGRLYAVLDVQASGQVPQLIEDHEAAGLSSVVSQSLRKLHAKFKAVLGESFGGYVDWWLVEAEGKQTSAYGLQSKKAAQKAAHGIPESAKAAEKAKHEAEQQAQALAQMAEAEKAEKFYTYGPGGAAVEKIQRKS